MALKNPYFHPQRATETRCENCGTMFPTRVSAYGDESWFCSASCALAFEHREALAQYEADMIDFEQDGER